MLRRHVQGQPAIRFSAPIEIVIDVTKLRTRTQRELLCAVCNFKDHTHQAPLFITPETTYDIHYGAQGYKVTLAQTIRRIGKFSFEVIHNAAEAHKNGIIYVRCGSSVQFVPNEDFKQEVGFGGTMHCAFSVKSTSESLAASDNVKEPNKLMA